MAELSSSFFIYIFLLLVGWLSSSLGFNKYIRSIKYRQVFTELGGFSTEEAEKIDDTTMQSSPVLLLSSPLVFGQQSSFFASFLLIHSIYFGYFILDPSSFATNRVKNLECGAIFLQCDVIDNPFFVIVIKDSRGLFLLWHNISWNVFE